jgi:hypothetical protein
MTRSLSIVALVTCTLSAHAQLGLPTPKLPATPTASAPSAKPPKCDAGAPTVTDDLVARYMKALQARDSMMGVIAKENSPTGQYYAALMQQRSLQRRENDFDNQLGPDWDKYLALQKRVQSGDTSAARQMQGVKPDPQSVTLPHLPWETQKAGNDRLDVAAEHAADFDYCGWTAVVDVMPMLVGALANNPNATSQQISAWGHPNGFSAAEIAAVKAHRIELARLLGVRYKSDAMLAAQNAPPPAAAMPAGAAATAGMGSMTFAACFQKESKPAQDYAAAHKADMEAAQKAGDTAKLMQYAQTMSQLQNAAMAKCKAASK